MLRASQAARGKFLADNFSPGFSAVGVWVDSDANNAGVAGREISRVIQSTAWDCLSTGPPQTTTHESGTGLRPALMKLSTTWSPGRLT